MFEKSFKKIILFAGFFLIIFCFKSEIVFAYEIEDLNIDVYNDIVLEPTKKEIWISPGEEHSEIISITNRTGKKKIINIEVEDFKGSKNLQKPAIEFLGSQEGPYSLKKYIYFEDKEILLEHGQRVKVPIKISLPKDINPGGLYTSVLVSVSNPSLDNSGQSKKNKVEVITRLACLFFVRVKGDVLEKGELADFKSLKKFYQKEPISFFLAYKNEGNVHLLPYGIIEIRNIFGRKVDVLEIDPWYVLPDSLRSREIEWNKKGFLMGLYKANLLLNRGYKDIVDSKEIVIWVIPWQIVLVGSASLVLVLLVLFAGVLKIKKRKSKNQFKKNEGAE